MNIWNFDVNNSFSILRDNVGVELFMSLIIANYYVYFTYALHGFKNRTGPAGPTGSTGNRSLIRSGYVKKPEIY